MTKPHIKRAHEILARLKDEPTGLTRTDIGVTTVADIQVAEWRLADAQAELRYYQRGDDGMHESLNGESKLKELHVDRLRGERIELLQNRVVRRRNEIAYAKRAWLAGVIGEDH